MTWLFLALLGGCSSKVYAPRPPQLSSDWLRPMAITGGFLNRLLDSWTPLCASVRFTSWCAIGQTPLPVSGRLEDSKIPAPTSNEKSLEGLGTRLSEPESRAALLRYAKRQDTSPFNTAKAAILLSDAPPAELLTVIEDHLLVDRHHSERAPCSLQPHA